MVVSEACQPNYEQLASKTPILTQQVFWFAEYQPTEIRPSRCCPYMQSEIPQTFWVFASFKKIGFSNGEGDVIAKNYRLSGGGGLLRNDFCSSV